MTSMEPRDFWQSAGGGHSCEANRNCVRFSDREEFQRSYSREDWTHEVRHGSANRLLREFSSSEGGQ